VRACVAVAKVQHVTISAAPAAVNMQNMSFSL